MLSCLCSVIENRGRKNVVRTKKWHTAGVAECVTDVLTTFWRLLWSITESIARQHGIYLYYIITKSLFYFKIFQHNAKAGLLPCLCPAFAQKKPLDVIHDLYKMKQFHWLLCVAKNCDWSRKITRLSNLTRMSLLVEWKLTTKAELNCEIYKSWRKCWKNQVSFCHRSSPVSRKVGRCLEIYRSWKNTLGKLMVTVNLEAIWMKGV